MYWKLENLDLLEMCSLLVYYFSIVTHCGNRSILITFHFIFLFLQFQPIRNPYDFIK